MVKLAVDLIDTYEGLLSIVSIADFNLRASSKVKSTLMAYPCLTALLILMNWSK